MFEVDPDTWADAGVMPGVRSVSIDKDGTGDAPLLESGSIQLDAPIGSDFRERYLRVVLTAEQDGQAERVNVVTLLCSATSGSIDLGIDNQELVGRSVLFPAAARKLRSGSYAPMGVDGAQWAGEMLRSCVAAPVTVESSFTLEDRVVFDLGKSYLECVWLVLGAGNSCIQLSGDGSIHIVDMPTEPSIVLDDMHAKLLHPGVKYNLDYSEVPNSYTAISGSQTVTIENNDPSSVTSIPYRGFVYDVVDSSPTRVNSESLYSYAVRMLEEKSTVPDTRTYTREYAPNAVPFSLVRGSLASVDIEGDLRIQTQSITCDKGITVAEKAAKEVRTWQM